LEILQCLRPPYISLGKHPTLLGQPLLINDLEDCNNMCKVFFIVPTGVNGITEVGLIRKLDLENLRFFVGRDNVNLRYVRNGWPVAQLPFLALGILQPVRRLEGGTHFGVLPESGFKQLKEDFGELVGTQPLEWWLEDLQNANISWSQKKNLLVPIPHVQPIGWSGTEKNWPLAKCTA
jgi:hypothetical protein